MNLKILFLILMYYGVISLVFISGGAYLTGASTSINLNSTNINADELDRGGLFGTGVSFGRFVGLVTVGIGLPPDTPSWFAVMFAVWQTIILILSIGFVISSIWDG
jgi:hypothetical protein